MFHINPLVDLCVTKVCHLFLCGEQSYNPRSEVVSEVTESTVFCDMTPYIPLEVNRPFGGTNCIHFQALGILREIKQNTNRNVCISEDAMPLRSR
jgi:hypothetical protein